MNIVNVEQTIYVMCLKKSDFNARNVVEKIQMDKTVAFWCDKLVTIDIIFQFRPVACVLNCSVESMFSRQKIKLIYWSRTHTRGSCHTKQQEVGLTRFTVSFEELFGNLFSCLSNTFFNRRFWACFHSTKQVASKRDKKSRKLKRKCFQICFPRNCT